MKFRSYIFIALAATAFVPFIAWSILQLSDTERRIDQGDLEQDLATADTVALISERLAGINSAAELTDRTLTRALNKGSMDLDALLKDIVESHPFIKNLHVDRHFPDGTRVLAFFPALSADGEIRRGQIHDNRWHARLSSAAQPEGTQYSPVLLSSERSPEPLMTFGRRMNGLPGHILSGALACASLFEDIRLSLENRGFTLTVLDEEQQYIWPLARDRITLWNGSTENASIVNTHEGPVFVTSRKLGAGLPPWTILVTRPESQRLMVRTTLGVQMVFLALGVLLLTGAAGWLACRPISRALSKLRGDIDEASFGSESNRIIHGPKELCEVQEAYWELRRRLAAKQVSLEEKNEHLESTVERREYELDAQEKLFHEVFVDIKDGIILLSSDWRPQFENPCAASMMNETVKPGMLAFCRIQFKAGNTESAVYEAEDGGKLKAWECRTFPLTACVAPLGQGVCVIFRDITDRREVERMKDDLISIVAHELKTPVTACRLQIELMRKVTGERAELTSLDADLAHLNHIVNDWLSVAKIDGGSFSVSPRVCQIGPLLRKAVRLVRTRHDMTFRMNIAEDAECLSVDPDAFVELFVNLITNACRYAKPSEKPDISVDAETRESWAVLSVKDRGIGFDPALSERIFDRFFQAASGRKRRTGGTGLGLVICRAICEAHGGSITASSQDGVTCFTILLPLGKKPDGCGLPS